MEKLSIGKMAKLNQTTIQALRLYDEMGILKPIEINEMTGYRYYDVRQSAKLDMIQYMKSTGMTLKEIKEVFDRQDLALLNEMLHQQLRDIKMQIKALMCREKAVKRMIDSYNRYLKAPEDGRITMEYIDDRKIYSRKLEVNFYEYGIEEYETILKALKKEMTEQGLGEYYYNAGTTITAGDFLSGRCVSNEIFVFVDQDCKSESFRILPVNMYACVYCDDFDKEKIYIERLRKFVEEMRLRICGDYICEVLTELPVTHAGKREMYLRLQVPVEFVKN